MARSLNRLNKDAQVVELVTDASTSVKALLGESSHFLTLTKFYLALFAPPPMTTTTKNNPIQARRNLSSSKLF